MSFNLRNRSLLTVQDYTPREFRYLLDLSRDLKRAKYARTEQKHLPRRGPAAPSRLPASTRAPT
jgi:ornithine carbamoyltransferase